MIESQVQRICRREGRKEEGRDIIFIIDDYSVFCTMIKEADAFLGTVKSMKKNGSRYVVYLVPASPDIPEFFDE